MDGQRIKSLEEFSEESEEFEILFQQLNEGNADEAARKELIDKIIEWLQGCAEQGRFIPRASADRRAFRSMLERWNFRLRGQGDNKGIDRLADFDPEAGVVLDCPCPYPGLDPYGEDQRQGFFGREKLISSVVEHLEQQGSRTFMIVGASGSGKSSVALAGILPRLEERYADTWLFSPTITPGSQPLVALAMSVSQAIDQKEQAEDIAGKLAAEPDNAFQQLAGLCGNKPLVLLVDQFEELFTLCQDARRRSTFSRVLCDLSDPAKSTDAFSCKILLTLRTDQQARFEESKDLFHLYSRLLGENNEHLRNLSAIGFDDIKRGIKKPAEEAGLRFIPGSLIDQLASQTAGLANGLPLLQFSLRRLWRMRPRNEQGESLDLVTEQMVRDLPDVERALGKVADDIFREFSDVQKKICERLFLELIVLDERYEEPLRRRRNENELNHALASLPGTAEDRVKVIEDFTREGLLRRFGDDENRQLEVAHEALLRHWEHIYRLLMGAEVKERLHHIKQVRRQAFYWAIHNESKDYLSLKGEPLQQACKYGEENWLVEQETTAYVAACVQEENRVRKGERREKLLRNFSLTLIVISAAVWFLFYTNKKANDAEIARQAADLISEGQYHILTDDIEKAKEYYMLAEELAGGNNRGAQLGLGLIYMRSSEPESLQKAVKYFENIIVMSQNSEGRDQLRTDSPLYVYYHYKGTTLHKLREHSEAIADLSHAIELLKSSSPQSKSLDDYYFVVGSTYLDFWNIDKSQLHVDYLHEAEKAFVEAINTLEREVEIARKNEEKPTDYFYKRSLSKYYFELGRTYLALKDLDKAKGAFENGILFRQRIEADHRDKIGTEYLQYGEVDAAISQFKKVVEIVKDEPSYYDHLSEAIILSRQSDDTQLTYGESFQNQAVLSDQQAELREHIALGDKYLRTGKAELAAREIQRAIELSKPADKDLPAYKIKLAQANLMLENYTEAERICAEVLDGKILLQARWPAYFCLGNALSAQQKYDAAIVAYTSAFEINQKDATTALFLADVYAKNNDQEQAQIFLIQAEELARDDAQLQVPEAREIFNKRVQSLKRDLESHKS